MRSRNFMQSEHCFPAKKMVYYRQTLEKDNIAMALCYKNLWKLLIDRDMTRRDLHRITGVSHATLAKMSKGENVSASILDRICTGLGCQIEDVVKVIPSEEENCK